MKLAYFIGQEQQEPTLFIFDEPTTGLHFHDIDRLLHAFNALIERGHTILVIEHNLDALSVLTMSSTLVLMEVIRVETS